MTTVEGIILAAGFSSRAGVYKMTLDLGGKPLIAHCLEGMYDVCSRIVIVAGYRYEKLLPIVSKYPKAQLVVNENYQAGMFSSVKKGLEFIRAERFFLTPGDYPAISEDVYLSMLVEAGDIVIPTFQGKKGHPVLLKSDLIQEITAGLKYTSLRDFIVAKSYKAVEVEDSGILYDLDTMEDYRKTLDVLGIKGCPFPLDISNGCSNHVDA